MASHRLKPLFSIKECMTCGSLYTRECCSIGSLENKILVPEPESSPCCAKCGTPVDGPYCRGCALLRKKFEEDLLTYCVENGIFQDSQDTFESSDDNTNVINALQEPIVVNQDPGVKFSQGPPLINQNCCYECGDSLDGIFCQQCICKFCGKGAHYGYNCPPKVPIISNPEQCNQTIAELPQTLPIVHPTCNYENENSFIYDSKPNSSNDFPSVLTHSPQFQFETYLCELCGNNAHYGYDCPPQFPFVYEQEPCYNQNFNDNYFPQNFQNSSQQYNCCANCGGPHETFQCQPMNEEYYEQNSCYDSNSFGFDQFQPPQYTVNHPIFNAQNEFLNSQNKLMEQMTSICDMVGQIMQKKEEERRIVEEQAAKEDMSIEDMRHEQQLVDYKIKEITNDLGYKRFRGEKIDEEYERDCEIRIRKLKQDFNEWGSEVRKKEQAYNEEQYAAARRRMLSIPFVDEDDYIPLGDIIARYSTSKAITPDLPIEEPDNSLSMGDEHLDTTSSNENLVPIPSEFEGISDDTSDVPNCDNNRINVESDLVESLINRDTSIVHSSKIDPILEEFAGELAHIAPIPPGIVEADFDPNDDTSSDDDSFENIEYIDASPSYSELVSLEKVNDVDQEEKEFDLEDIFQIQDVILREKLLNVHRLISNIESLKVNPTPDFVLKSPSPFPIPVMDSDAFFEESDTSLSHLDNSLPEFETFSNHTEETRSGKGLISIDNSNEPLLELPEFESFHFDPSFPRPPPEPPDVEICLHFEPDAPVIDNFNELNEDQRGSEIIFLQNVEDDDSFTFVIRTFLPFLTYPETSPLSCSTGSEDTIFDPGIITFPFSYLDPVAFSTKVSCSKIDPTIYEDSRVRCCTDKTKITRKPSKTGKHGHENGRAQKKPGNQAKVKKPKLSVNYGSTKALIGSLSKGMPRGSKEAQEIAWFYIGIIHTTSTNVSSMDCQLGNPLPLRKTAIELCGFAICISSELKEGKGSDKWYVLNNSPEIDSTVPVQKTERRIPQLVVWVVDDDITDDEDTLPYDLADSDDEDLINVDDDGVDKVYSSEEED
ncbi:hypothetical protein Tco_0768197 [Tanacetum coccineum]